MKPVIGVVGTLSAVIYCGYLIFYFVDLTGSVEDATAQGLGPTIMGLGAFGLLFFIVLAVKMVRIFVRPRAPKSGGGGRGDASTSENDGGFDADAAVARYMAQRSAEGAASSSAPPPAPKGGGPAARPSFGRKTR